MKSLIKIAMLTIVVLLALSACNSTPKFKNVVGKEWLLTEIQTGETQKVMFNRQNLEEEGFGNIFSVTFDGERISSKGAPNTFISPYKLDKKQVIAVQPMAETEIDPVREPEKLKEQDYYLYLQNAYKWNLTKEKLFELYSKDSDENEVVLVYKQR